MLRYQAAISRCGALAAFNGRSSTVSTAQYSYANSFTIITANVIQPFIPGTVIAFLPRVYTRSGSRH